MSTELNFKPYLICVSIVSILSCFFSYKVGLSIILGTSYFFISDRLNHYKFSRINDKTIAIGKIFLILIIQLILIVAVAYFSYRIGGLVTFFATFAGIIIPHIYFIIVEVRKIKK